MTTKAFRREVASLASAKGRKKLGAFIAEGTKCVLDTLPHFSLRWLIATPAWLAEHPLAGLGGRGSACTSERIVEANRGEIGEMSSMTLAPDVLAVYDLPAAAPFIPGRLAGDLVVALDRIQDPGNLGTIMRTADWMGVSTIIASADTADCFNPKVVQASMGAISRVSVIYGDLPEMLAQFPVDTDIYGTFLDGADLRCASLRPSGVLVMGNEGQGISPAVEACVTQRLFIPSFPPGRATSESLNVATAAAIALYALRTS